MIHTEIQYILVFANASNINLENRPKISFFLLNFIGTTENQGVRRKKITFHAHRLDYVPINAQVTLKLDIAPSCTSRVKRQTQARQ